MKAWLKDLITQLLWNIKLTDPDRYSTDKLIILTFHRVLTDAQKTLYPLPGLVATVDEFDWILTELKQYFTCGTLENSLKIYREKVPFEKPPLAITFDDGQLDNFENALPILEKHAINATFYLPTDYIGTNNLLWHDVIGFSLLNYHQQDKRKGDIEKTVNEFVPVDLSKASVKTIINTCKQLPSNQLEVLSNKLLEFQPTDNYQWAGMMNWDHIKQLNGRGCEIGSHTKTHPILTELGDRNALVDEIANSKLHIEEMIDTNVTSFCYPNGDQNESIRRIVKEAGYANAVTTEMGNNHVDYDPLRLNRIDIDPYRVKNRLNSLSKQSLHYRLSCFNR